MLENIIKANELAVRCEKHPIALSKLDFIVDMIIMEEARYIEAFANLPSMRDIRIICSTELFDHWPSDWSLSGIKRLE